MVQELTAGQFLKVLGDNSGQTKSCVLGQQAVRDQTLQSDTGSRERRQVELQGMKCTKGSPSHVSLV